MTTPTLTDELAVALEGLLEIDPAWRTHPMGPPDSGARFLNDAKIVVEDKALDALDKYRAAKAEDTL